jgi:Predicted membrane protein
MARWLCGHAWLGVINTNGARCKGEWIYRCFVAALFVLWPDVSSRCRTGRFTSTVKKFGVCSRCFGIYFGLFFGFVIYPLWRRIDEIEPISRIWLFLSLIPIGVDWSLTIFGIWENTFTSRFITGLILGVACATFIVPATVEITRNFKYRSRMKKAA